MSSPSTVVLGANLETEIALAAMLQAGASVQGILTLPPSASAGTSDYRDLRGPAGQHRIPVVLTNDVNDVGTVEALRRLGPDYLFILGWSQICRSEILSVPRRMAIGTHPSLLPKGRGRAPLPWAIIDGDPEGAVSFFEATLRADAGAILHQERFAIPHGIDATMLYDLVATHLARGACEVYQRIREGTLTSTPQDEAKASYRAKRVPADGWLDFSKPAEELDRLVRATTRPYPGAYSYYADRKVVFWRSALAPRVSYQGTPGQILLRQDGRLYVQAGDNPLWLWDAESDGVVMAARDFRTGERFGYRVEDEICALKETVRELMGKLPR